MVSGKKIWLGMGATLLLARVDDFACLCGSHDFSSRIHQPCIIYWAFFDSNLWHLNCTYSNLLVERREACLEMGRQEIGPTLPGNVRRE